MTSVPGTTGSVYKFPLDYIATVKVYFPPAVRRTIPASKSTITQQAPGLELLDITSGDAMTRFAAMKPVDQPFVRPEEIRYVGRAFSSSEMTTIANTVTLLPHYMLPKGFAAGRDPDGLSNDQKLNTPAFEFEGYACFLEETGNDYYAAQYYAAHEIGHVYFGDDESRSYLSPDQRNEWVGIWNQSVKKGLPDDDFTCNYAQLSMLTKVEMDAWRKNAQEQKRVSEYEGNAPLTITARRSNGEGRVPALVFNDGSETMSEFNACWFMNSEALANQAIEKAQAGNDVLLQKVGFFTKNIYGQNESGQACMGNNGVRPDRVLTFTMGDECISRQQVKTKNIKLNDKIYLVPDFENPVDTQIILHMGTESNRKFSEDVDKWMRDKSADELRKIKI